MTPEALLDSCFACYSYKASGNVVVTQPSLLLQLLHELRKFEGKSRIAQALSAFHRMLEIRDTGQKVNVLGMILIPWRPETWQNRVENIRTETASELKPYTDS